MTVGVGGGSGRMGGTEIRLDGVHVDVIPLPGDRVRRPVTVGQQPRGVVSAPRERQQHYRPRYPPHLREAP
jgi:hypothetical protein